MMLPLYGVTDLPQSPNFNGIKVSADIKDNAERFAVYRMGVKNFWECTYEEVAQAAGITVARVKRICAATGWCFACEEGDVIPADSFMSADNSLDAGDIHV